MRSVRFDARARKVIANGRTTSLQERPWQVLALLRKRSPLPVSRREFVDAVWNGNYLTGEKGLHQALWAIRSALNDNAREPTYIRTLPRVGYQWIESSSSHRNRTAVGIWRSVGVGTVALLILSTSASHVAVSGAPELLDVSADPRRIAKRAWLWNNDIVVELEGGCRGVLKNEGNRRIGHPVISSDGLQVAFTVIEKNRCRLVTIDLADGSKKEFGSCPSEV